MEPWWSLAGGHCTLLNNNEQIIQVWNSVLT